ncbi:hypothetical protein RB653_000452 [Dictyostelium firmibasis]|uniref:Uncharacterized protein n=1 Tax=Dictyostelium firmibasis TaxID=79012 RepID=A0AAN7U2W9_9MYCE
MRFLLLLVTLLSVTTNTYADFTEDQMTMIVSSFNKLRSTVTPKILGDYNQISWSEILYANALSQTQTCQSNSLYSSAGAAGLYGESYSYFDNDPSVNDVQDTLSSPKQYYNYDDTECVGNHDCTSYTNIIWNATTQIGCSKNLCNGKTYVVCNFNPPGSFSGIQPYTARQHSSQSTMSYEESPNKIVNLNQRLVRREDDHIYTASVPSDGSFDWRDNGVVGYPKDSSNCASGWAFTAAGIYESRVAMRTRHRYDFSSQQLLDCINFSNFSITNYTKCSRFSGELNKALMYVQNYGLQSTSTYPYVGASSQGCSYNQSSIAVQGGDVEYSQVGRDSIIEKCRKQGPVGVGIFVTNEFLNYAGGIFQCNNTLIDNANINHNVLLVGYNQQDNYYIIKNNFGRTWGENGYARVTADVNKDCLIGKNPAYSVQI